MPVTRACVGGGMVKKRPHAHISRSAISDDPSCAKHWLVFAPDITKHSPDYPAAIWARTSREYR